MALSTAIDKVRTSRTSLHVHDSPQRDFSAAVSHVVSKWMQRIEGHRRRCLLAPRQAGKQASRPRRLTRVKVSRRPGVSTVQASAWSRLTSMRMLSWAWFRGSRGHGMTLHGRYGWNVVNVPVAEPGGRVSPGTRLPLMPGTYQQQPFGP